MFETIVIDDIFINSIYFIITFVCIEYYLNLYNNNRHAHEISSGRLNLYTRPYNNTINSPYRTMFIINMFSLYMFTNEMFCKFMILETLIIAFVHIHMVITYAEYSRYSIISLLVFILIVINFPIELLSSYYVRFLVIITRNYFEYLM